MAVATQRYLIFLCRNCRLYDAIFTRVFGMNVRNEAFLERIRIRPTRVDRDNLLIDHPNPTIYCDGCLQAIGAAPCTWAHIFRMFTYDFNSRDLLCFDRRRQHMYSVVDNQFQNGLPHYTLGLVLDHPNDRPVHVLRNGYFCRVCFLDDMTTMVAPQEGNREEFESVVVENPVPEALIVEAEENGLGIASCSECDSVLGHGWRVGEARHFSLAVDGLVFRLNGLFCEIQNHDNLYERISQQ